MRIVIVDTYYPRFVERVYAAHPGLANEPYEQQWKFLMRECFGTADFYSRNLKAIGHDATEIVANCTPLQAQWVRENARGAWHLRPPSSILRRIAQRLGRSRPDWLDSVLIAQVARMRPDVLHIQDMPGTSRQLLRQLRPYVGVITGQIACEYDRAADFSDYDLVLSSLPHYVDRFRQAGWPSAYFQLGFEASIRERLEPHIEHDVVFVGSVSIDHRSRIEFLETIARRVPLRWWGRGVEHLPEDSALRRSHQGEAWGIRMYQILSRARITLNYHIDIAGPNANNMRLYEATGAGSMLLTDMKANLSTIFEPGREVAVFDSVDQCVSRLEYYLANESERSAIAAAGLKRTLSEHTYRHRMEQFVSLMEPILTDKKHPMSGRSNATAAPQR
jgi:spore maturation protein CgeB